MITSLVATADAAPASDSRLNWCRLFDGDVRQSAPVARELTRVLALANEALALEIKPVKSLHLEGTLDADPLHQESARAVADLNRVVLLGICARTADAPLATKCKSKALDAVLAWARVYEPTGNPINESRLIPLVQTADLLDPLLSADQRAQTQRFLRALIAGGDAFYGKLKPSDSRIPNNWGTWRLTIRALAAVAVGDQALIQDTAKLLRAHLRANLRADGSSLDFAERDALHYHTYDLQAYVQAYAQAPAVFPDAWAQRAIAKGLGFLQPFWTGKATHIEFVHSKVPFDIARKKAGQKDYQNVPWDPHSARLLLRLARPFFPDVRPWTESAVDPNYDPGLKVLVAACGDGVTP